MWVSSTGREAQWRLCGQTVSEVLKFCSAQDTEISSQRPGLLFLYGVHTSIQPLAQGYVHSRDSVNVSRKHLCWQHASCTRT